MTFPGARYLLARFRLLRADSLKNGVIDEAVRELLRQENLILLSRTHSCLADSEKEYAPSSSLGSFVNIQNMVELKIMTMTADLEELRRLQDDGEKALQHVISNTVSVSGSSSDWNGISSTPLPTEYQKRIKRLKFALFTAISFTDDGSDYVDREFLITLTCTPEFVVRRAIYQEIVSYWALIDAEGKKDRLFRKYLNPDIVDKGGNDYCLFKVDPLRFWKEHKNTFPFLFQLSRRLLAGHPSSTRIERVFSIATNLYDKRRKTLTADYMEDIMIAKLNLKNGIQTQKSTVSLADFKRNNGGRDHSLIDEITLFKKFRCPKNKRRRMA